MAKIAFCADAHIANHHVHGGPVEIGLNDRCNITLDVLEKAYYLAKEKQCDAFFVLGDLFDTDKPIPQIITATQDILADEELKPIILVGTHDPTSYEEDDHALGPLQGVCRIYDKPSQFKDWNTEFILIPPQNGAVYEWLPEILSGMKQKAKTRVLCLHVGISDAGSPVFLINKKDSINFENIFSICEQHNISFLFTGHWHNHQRWSHKNTKIIQMGALCPTGWDNPGFTVYGKVLIWDTETHKMEFHEIPGPRFTKFTLYDGVKSNEFTDFVEKCSEYRKRGNKIFIRAFAMNDNMKETIEYFKALEEKEIFYKVEIHPESTEVTIAARKAASAARAAESLDEALAKFVKEMPIENGVDRKAVLARAKGYLDG